MDINNLKLKKSIHKLFEFGIIVIDKPSGPTSFTVSEHVKKILNLRKTSHFGTLDPKVTGVLPIALNRACKLTGFFLGHDKEYVGIVRFHEDVDRKKVEETIKEKFTGVITQKPPVKSRVKRQEREREIKSFKILEQDGKDFLFKTVVQGGTYIRKICDDLGKALGIGAHMLELRRTRAGIFNEDKIYTLYELEKITNELNEKKLLDLDVNSHMGWMLGVEEENYIEKLKEMIIPAEIVREVYPAVEIKKESVDRILHGQPIYNKNLIKQVKLDSDKIVSVFCGKQFIGMFRVINQNDIFAKSEFTMQSLD